jgi:hypothetical protein
MRIAVTTSLCVMVLLGNISWDEVFRSSTPRTGAINTLSCSMTLEALYFRSQSNRELEKTGGVRYRASGPEETIVVSATRGLPDSG